MHAFLKGGPTKKVTQKDDSASAGKSGSSQKYLNKPTPWVEKYRPKRIDDVVEQKEIVSVLRECLSRARNWGLQLFPMNEVGKTSTIMAAARQLFGDLYKERILELNASDDRGIQVIRDKVKNFARLSATSGFKRSDGTSCPPLKIVILDEADSMTNAAQSALRRTIEKETKTTRFCLICNYISCIIPPITSRCAKFRFKPLGEGMIRLRLEMICKEENVSYTPEALAALIDASGGDLRRAITSLQSCARLKGADKKIEATDVAEMTGAVPHKWIEQFVESSRSNDYKTIESRVDQILYEAYPVLQVIEQVHDYVMRSDNTSDLAKAYICEKLAVSNWQLQGGASEYLQLIDIACSMAKIFQQNSKRSET
uniref:Putative replication factor c small subunit n=1 Tax=Panstrongylus lignarius TaxID=156445 RepID=A0A224XM41_9HEMI